MTGDASTRNAHVIKRAGGHGPRFIARVMTAIASGGRGDVRLRLPCGMHTIVAHPAFFRSANKHVVVMATIAAEQCMRAEQRKAGRKVVEGLAVGKAAVGQRERTGKKHQRQCKQQPSAREHRPLQKIIHVAPSRQSVIVLC